jgi:adenylate cyclase
MNQPRVLVVDDSPLVLHLVRAALESARYEVITAKDGMEGLDKVRQWHPDVIVTDSVMPGIDGFALLRRLKEQPDTGLIPVIMLTSADVQESGQSEVQPDAFVAKSSDLGPLLKKVHAALANRQKRD